MLQSLLVKLGMLVLTMGAVFWIGWQAPDTSPRATVSDAAPLSGGSSVITEKQDAIQAAASLRTEAAAIKATRVENSGRQPTAIRGLLDLNRASADELESLPGIGAVLAQRVIAYRKSAGGFRSVDDLRQVKGIGEKKFERVKPLVMVATTAPKGKAGKQPS